MDTAYYISVFNKATAQLDQKLLKQKQIMSAVGIYGNSVFLKLYKAGWANTYPDPLSAESRIFFSIWVNDAAIAEQKLLYNIHALKLRKLNGYTITSRHFAAAFRSDFASIAHLWPNVSVAYGPLTLMQGWQKTGTGSFQKTVLGLCGNFFETDHLIDDLLLKYIKI